MGKRNAKSVVVGEDGDPCPRCATPMQVREHAEITPELRAKAYYYSRWFCCMNQECTTTTVMPPRFVVGDGPRPAAPGMETGAAAVRRIMREEPKRDRNVSALADDDPAKLLHQLAMAVINAGRSEIFASCPDVVRYFGSTPMSPAGMAAALGVEPGQFQMPDGAVIRYEIATPVRSIA